MSHAVFVAVFLSFFLINGCAIFLGDSQYEDEIDSQNTSGHAQGKFIVSINAFDVLLRVLCLLTMINQTHI
jgi:hypothetical protein